MLCFKLICGIFCLLTDIIQLEYLVWDLRNKYKIFGISSLKRPDCVLTSVASRPVRLVINISSLKRQVCVLFLGQPNLTNVLVYSLLGRLKFRVNDCVTDIETTQLLYNLARETCLMKCKEELFFFQNYQTLSAKAF